MVYLHTIHIISYKIWNWCLQCWLLFDHIVDANSDRLSRMGFYNYDCAGAGNYCKPNAGPGFVFIQLMLTLVSSAIWCFIIRWITSNRHRQGAATCLFLSLNKITVISSKNVPVFFTEQMAGHLLLILTSKQALSWEERRRTLLRFRSNQNTDMQARRLVTSRGAIIARFGERWNLLKLPNAD